MQNNGSWLVSLIKSISKFPISWLQAISEKISRAQIFVTNKQSLKGAYLNLQIAFPECTTAEKQRWAKQAAINEMTSYFEFFKIWGSSAEENIQKIHQVHGEAYLHQALAAQQGVVLVVPHFGTWEVMNAWVSQYTAMTIMYKPIKNAAVDGFVRDARSREHIQLVPTDETGVKQIFKALKQGGTTAILPDHSPDFEGDFSTWFDVPLYSSHLISKLVQKTKAAALLLYAIRNAHGGFEMYIEPLPKSIQNPEVDGTLLIHQAIEALIRKHPEHYHWSYKRFKAHPQLRDVYYLPEQDALHKIDSLKQPSLHSGS